MSLLVWVMPMLMSQIHHLHAMILSPACLCHLPHLHAVCRSFITQTLLTLTVEKLVCQICAIDCNHLPVQLQHVGIHFTIYYLSQCWMFVCLCVCDRHNCEKMGGRIWLKFCMQVSFWPRKNSLTFGGSPPYTSLVKKLLCRGLHPLSAFQLFVIFVCHGAIKLGISCTGTPVGRPFLTTQFIKWAIAVFSVCPFVSHKSVPYIWQLHHLSSPKSYTAWLGNLDGIHMHALNRGWVGKS